VTARRLDVDGLGLDLSGRSVLDGVTLAAEAGGLLAVSGPSGAGKSVLLLVVAGLLAPTRGRVLLDSAPAAAAGFGTRDRFGLILETPGLVAELTAHENVALPLQARGLERRAVGRRCADALDSVGLSDVGDRLADELSGGQRQRVGVARALAGSPDVLLADEPTAELDAENRTRILALLSELATEHVVVVASNDPEVTEACDRVVSLRDGRVVDPGGPAADGDR
jgi:putative ABC transport system ATP-binding protein